MRIRTAHIKEVFSSIQGEGIFVGARQIFVRFRDCNLRCIFCDERDNMDSRDYSPQELFAEVGRLERMKRPHHSVSLTGGEPLLYTPFLKDFLGFLKRGGIKSYLETNGTLPDKLADIVDQVDIIAMDFKLPSSTGDRPYWDEHREFLNIALKRKVFVKAVVTPTTRTEDIEMSLDIIKKTGEKIPFIIQPVTPLSSSEKKVEKTELLGFLEFALKNKFEDVRIVPQMHKTWGIK
ncbi:MAG: 7-carboxy-7-deazaguanine synthase QueE [Candidatus Omnitrophota bacterium]